jgi:hypothetical protein
MLFFGWFKEIRQKDNGHYEYSDHTRIGKDGAHIIYGYLVVGSIDPVASIKDKLLDHPHTAAHYEASFDNNTYITAASCGLFKYHENLVLSKPRHQKSIWKLPDNFKDVQFKYLVNTGTPDHCQAPYRGQELIAMSHQQEMHEWASDLIKAHTNS